MSQIKATIIADSACSGSRITTYELEYPRFIHGELMTHRVFSRNAASSRAIPVDAMIKLIEDSPAIPVQWGLNQSGMQASNEHASPASCEWVWNRAAKSAVEHARTLQGIGLHKQVINRLIEPFQIMKTVVTSTEYDNFFYLRNHSDAQPEIAELAKLMHDARCDSEPNTLKAGEWHVPYVYTQREDGKLVYLTNEDGASGEKCLTLAEALKVSASCCAQVSYRKQDESLEKALKIWDMLVTMKPVHASPFEHQATPMKETGTYPMVEADQWEEGVTHINNEGFFWSGNFKGWIQHRQLIDNNVCNNYEETK